MMIIRYDLSDLRDISSWELQKVVSELEILATKDFPHDNRRLALLKSPTVRVREISVRDSFERRRNFNFGYSVKDYGFDDKRHLFPVGEAEYTSQDLMPEESKIEERVEMRNR